MINFDESGGGWGISGGGGMEVHLAKWFVESTLLHVYMPTVTAVGKNKTGNVVNVFVCLRHHIPSVPPVVYCRSTFENVI